MSDLGLWPARVTWFAVPLLAGPALADGLADRSTAVRLVAEVLLWGGWAVAFGASLVPRSSSLAVYRSIVPAAVVATAWAAAIGGDLAVSDAVALASALVATIAALLPVTGEAFVDGSSYGPERRMVLRPPLLLLAGPVELTWAAAVAGAAAGPLLLAARQWVLGGAALVVGVPVVVVAGRALHQLSRRWLVFVPSGFVLHDPLATPEAHLFVRRMVRRIGPALEGTDALDLTGGAIGLVLEVELDEPTDILRRSGRRQAETVQAAKLLFCPTRPAALLAEAAQRRLPVG